MTKRVTLVTNEMATVMVGEFATTKKALAAAKRAAGRGATFVRRGVDSGYRGPLGMAWVAS